jgi:toxin ParE1/3/4
VQYFDAHSSTAADRFLEEFFQAANLLAERPRLGPVRRRRGRLKGLRSWPLTNFGPYVLFYLPIENGIDVVRVLHGARDIDRELRK